MALPRSPEHDRFLALLGQHRGLLYKVASAYARTGDERGDLLQEIVVAAWRSFPRFDPRRPFGTWLYRVAMNVAISFARGRTRRSRDLVSLGDFGLEVAGADQAVAESSTELRRLQQRIAELEPLNRALILLHLDGCSANEMAEVLGISATNASTRVSRIRQQLQREFRTERRASEA